MAEVTPTGVRAPTPADTEAARKQAEQNKQNLEKNRADATKKLEADEKVRVDDINEKAKRESGSKPTPTQRENDLARLGLLNIDEKEDDGSGPEVMPGALRRDVSAEEAAKYRTREMNKK